MKTLEQLAREADPGFGNEEGVMSCAIVGLDALARFRAACRAEALEEAAQRLDAEPERMAFATEFAAAIREMK